MSQRLTGRKAFNRNLRRRNMKKKQSALSLARQNKKAISAGLEFIEQETRINSAVTDVPTITHIPPAGRGLKTRMTSIHVKGYINNPNTEEKIIRVDVVLDRHPLAVDPTSAVLYATSAPRVSAFKNITYKERFKFLRSMMIPVPLLGIGAVPTVIDEYIKMNHIITTKTADDFTSDAIQTNGVYLVYWMDSANNPPVVNFDCRIITQDETT